MKIHTTNYKDTFIEIVEDCLVSKSQIPPQEKEKAIANLQYEIIFENPYQYTSDNLIFVSFF